MGRRSGEPARPEQIIVCLTLEEKRLVGWAAEHERLPRATFIRQVVLGQVREKLARYREWQALHSPASSRIVPAISLQVKPDS